MKAKLQNETNMSDSNFSIQDPWLPDDYEACARCGHDHEYEGTHAYKLHSNCTLCLAEIDGLGIGNGPDHDCKDHQRG